MKTERSIVRRGFSLIDLLLVIATLVGMLFVFLPMLTRQKIRNPGVSCVNNLKQVGLAFRIWAGDNNDKMPMQLSVTNGGVLELATQGSAYATFLILSNELCTPKILFCPAETNPQRRMASIFAPTLPPAANAGTFPFTETNSLSYFVGVDAEETNPATVLTGDDHFSLNGAKPSRGLLPLATNAPVEWRDERHPKQGYVALADGSVQGFSSSALRNALANTGVETNRLAMP
jgi:competence protein ComGC